MMKMNHFFTIALCAIILSLVFMPLSTAQTNAPSVRLHLGGPSVLGTLRTGTYSVTFTDPENRNWEYVVFVTAPDTTGAHPLADSPLKGNITPESSVFSFEVTAQQNIGELEIHINCTAGSVFYKKVQKISVVSPVVIEAEVYNPTNVKILNATAQFFVNDIEIDKQIIPLIDANQTILISSEWITKDKNPGWHTSKVIIDLNGDGTGDMVIEDRFYIEGESNWTFAIMVLVGLLILIIGFGYISKRKMK